jgi:glucan phosphoethanolaminetransferase (alkaline phosphatase superfamily)
MNNKSKVLNVTSWIFGVIVFAIGVLNLFWGNDAGFGAFLIILSFVYFPLANFILRKIAGFSIPRVAKIVLGVFILWAAVGVGELFNKIELMRMDF